jgi:hypothetical protein
VFGPAIVKYRASHEEGMAEITWSISAAIGVKDVSYLEIGITLLYTARAGPMCETSTAEKSFFVQIAIRVMAATTVLLRGNQAEGVRIKTGSPE